MDRRLRRLYLLAEEVVQEIKEGKDTTISYKEFKKALAKKVKLERTILYVYAKNILVCIKIKIKIKIIYQSEIKAFEIAAFLNNLHAIIITY